MNIPSSTRINKLLSALPSEACQRLLPHLEIVSLSLGQVICEPGKIIREVYFPSQSMISIVTSNQGTSKPEIALVGNECMIGLPVVLGGDSMPFFAVVQVADSATRIDAQVLKQEFDRGEQLQKVLLLYTQARLTQISQTTVCLHSHTIEQRLARWLLTIGDCLQKDTLTLTQHLLSQLLGVRRATITEAAGTLQRQGIISYKRGQITILDRVALESRSCGCYLLIKKEFQRLIG